MKIPMESPEAFAPFTKVELGQLYVPPRSSHKGQNGKLLVIGGSHLFHAASLWALTVASRIVDLVHYASVPENNEIVQKAKEEFRNGIVITRDDLDGYINEDDCVLIGPGMTRDEETQRLTDTLLRKFPHKQWVIDAGALQMMDIALIPKKAILTPHQKEFEGLWEKFQLSNPTDQTNSTMQTPLAVKEKVKEISAAYGCVVLLKGAVDIACSPETCRIIEGGNAGMTKGGTGDVLAGLVAALCCKNSPMLSACAGSYINKATGDELYRNCGPYFNASDLAGQIPRTMARLLSVDRL